MSTLIASGSITLFDQNDAIISGVQPVSPAVDALWIDTSVTPNLLKKYNGTGWDPVSQLDPNIVTNIGAIQLTLSNMADDNKLDFNDRQLLKEDISQLVGTILSPTESLPTVTVLDTSGKGSFATVRKTARTAGLLTTDASYVALTNAYNTLRTYLNSHTPKSWDTSVANKEQAITVTKETFRQHWLNYYTAELNLAEATTLFLSSSLTNLKDTTLPALEDKLLSEAEKTAIRSSLLLTQTEKKDIDAVYLGYKDNPLLNNKTIISNPYENYVTAYNETVTDINQVLSVPTGTVISASLIEAVANRFSAYGDSLALLRTALQKAQAAIEQKAAENASKEFSTALEDYVTNLQLADLQHQVDGSITSWFGDNEPTLNNYPANLWTTSDERNVQLGDLYYDNKTGYAYRFTLQGSVFQWLRITDSDITKALQTAQKAQDTADQKRRVFMEVSPKPPYDIGDLWTTSGELFVAIASKASEQTYHASDWKKATKYTDDTKAETAITTVRNLREATDLKQDIRIGLKVGYSSFTAQNPDSIYLCGVKTNPETFKEELIDQNGSIYNRQTTEVITTPKQNIGLTQVPNGTSGYIVWDNQDISFYFIYYVTEYTNNQLSDAYWKTHTGTRILLDEAIYVVGELEIA